MIDLDKVIFIHNVLIDQFGGGTGIRDLSSLESAIARPYQTFGGTDLYTSPVDKAAAIFESIIINHPFVDGNKRTAYTLMRLILLEHQLDIEASESDKYEMTISASMGGIRFEKIRVWLLSHLIIIKK